MTALKQIIASGRLSLVIALGLLPVLSAAQQNYTIKNFTNENGLSQNAISDMAMDYLGYLWIGTQQGLIRYDGSSFKNFVLKEFPENNLDNFAWSLMNTPVDRQLVVRTKNGTLYSIHNGTPQLLDTSVRNDFAATAFQGQYPTQAVFRQMNVRQAVLDSQMYWGLSVDLVPLTADEFLKGENGDRSVQLYKGAVLKKQIPLPAPLKYLVQAGSVALAICNTGVFYYDTATGQLSELKITDRFAKILDDAAGSERPAFFQGLFSGRSFMNYETTLYLLVPDIAGKRMDFLPQFTLPEKHRWTKIVYDSTNSTFFLASANEGIFQVKLKKINSFNLNAYLADKNVYDDFICYAVLRINDSTIVTPGGFRVIENNKKLLLDRLKNVYSNRKTIALLGDSALLCISKGGALYYLQRENYKIPHVFNQQFNKILSSEVSLLMPEGDSVWISNNNGLFCATAGSLRNYRPRHYKTGTNLGEIHLFYRLNKEEVLVSASLGFFKLHMQQRIYKEVPGLEKMVVRHINPYQDALIISAYRSGLYILKNNRVSKVPLPENMPEMKECHSTYIDKQGYIWITTNKGLFKSTAESVIAAAIGEAGEPYFFCYGRNDGIENLEFNGGGTPAYAVLPGGRVFYPSMGGVVTFNPSELTDRISDAPVNVETISIDKQNTADRDSVLLPADFGFLDIKLSAANLGDPRNLSLEYKFDDGPWEKIPTGNLHITLVKIPSGLHELLIRKRTGFGDKDYVYTRLFINKKKNYYEQWWFFPLVLLLVTGLIWLILRLHARNLIKKREQLQQLVDRQTEELSQAVEAKDMMISIITHDMLTPLRHVSFIAAILEKGKEKDPLKATDALRDIKETADKIYSGSQSIVNWMKYNNKNVAVNKQTLHLYSFTESVLDLYKAIAKSKNIQLVNDVNKTVFVEVDHNIFTTIFTNIISNAIKHTTAGEIKIATLAGADGKTILRVTDTGDGINETTLSIIREVLKGNLRALKASSKVAPGLGYIIISELIKIHDLPVAIESTAGAGTTVSILI